MDPSRDTPRDSWRCFVDHHGAVEEFDDRTGAHYISAFHDVTLYARALLALDRDRIVFHLADHQSRWHRVQITQGSMLRGRRFATVQMTLVTPPFNLTLRELDILTLVALGLSNENIAVRLDISKRTTQKHIENLFGKMQLWSRAALASYAVQQGICRLPTPGGSTGGPALGLSEIEDVAARLPELKSEATGDFQPYASRLPRANAPSRANRVRPLIIGLPYAGSGRGQTDSIEMLNGAKLAISEINTRGGVCGRPVTLETISFDSGDPASTFGAYHALIEKEVDGITAGYACYSTAVHDIVGEAGIPYLHAATMHRAVERVRDSRARLGNIFQTCASDVNYGVGLARVVNQLQAAKHWCTQKKRLAVLQPLWPDLDIGMEYLEAELGRRGWQIDVIDVASDTTDCWQRAVDRLHQLDPSVIMLASFFVEDAIAFQRAFLDNPLRAIIYDIYGPSVPQFQSELGAASEGVVWATTSGLYADPIAEGFRDRYFRAFDVLPGNSQAGLAYDRVQLLVGAWIRAEHPRLFRDVASELRTSINRGVNGSYFLGSEGQVGLAYPDDTRDQSISQAHLIFQVQNGRNTIIGPAPYATSRIRTPPWCA
jgi:branched-chain amino acid transport system substrate-binding protein